jgi:hypothetical protein
MNQSDAAQVNLSLGKHTKKRLGTCVEIPGRVVSLGLDRIETGIDFILLVHLMQPSADRSHGTQNGT